MVLFGAVLWGQYWNHVSISETYSKLACIDHSAGNCSPTHWWRSNFLSIFL